MKLAHLAACLAVAIALAASPQCASAQSEDEGLAAIVGFERQAWRSVVGMAARPADSNTAYRGAVGNSGGYTCANTTPGGCRLVRYPFTVPDARTLQFVRIWGRKTTGTADTTMRLRRSCMSQDAVDPTTDILGSTIITSTSGPFTAFLGGDPSVPSNLNCRYWLELEFGSSGIACASGTQDLIIDRVRVQSLLSDRIFRGTFRQYSP